MKRRIVLILIILTVTLFVAAGLYWYLVRNQSSRLLARIELAIRAEKLDKALELADSYISQHSEDWHGYYQKARIYIRSGRYTEARGQLNKLLAEQERLQPNQFSTRLLLADTYSLPARRSLVSSETNKQTAGLKAAVEQLRQAKDILSQIQAEDDQENIILQQAVGMIQADIGVTLTRLSDRFNQEADIASTAGFESLRDDCRKQAVAALGQAQETLTQSIQALLAVVKQDPNHHEAAQILVRLCIQQNDQPSLEAARSALLSAEKPAPVAMTMLIVNDLQRSYEQQAEYQPDEQLENQEKVLKAARQLDELLQQYPDEIQIKLQRASLALMLSDLTVAGRLVKEILENNPHQAQARLLEAKMMLQRGEIAQAESKLFALKAEFIQWPEAHYTYAQVALALGKKELARQALRRVTELQPDHPGARRYLAESLIQDGFYNQAFLDAREYYKSHPDKPSALRLMVTTAIHTDQPDLARQALEKTQTNHASDPLMLMVVADGYALLGDKANLVKTLQLAADSQPTTILGRLAQARALANINRTAEAEKLLREESARYPQYHRINFLLGQVYADTGRNFQALEQFKEALRLDNTNVDYRLAIAQVLLEIGDWDECRQMLDEISSSNDKADFLRLQLRLIQGQSISSNEVLQQMSLKGAMGVALSCLQLGRPQECVDICQNELKENHDSSDVRMLLGQAYLALGQRDNCIEQYKILLQRAPEDLSNYLILARLLTVGAGPEEAAGVLASITGAQSYMVLLAKGWMFERAENFAPALEIYNRVAENSQNPRKSRDLARMYLARTLTAQGRFDQAIAELDKITAAKTPGSQVDFMKALLLVKAQRLNEANPLLQTLGKTALEKQDGELLKKIVGLYLSLEQTDAALALCDESQRVFPHTPEPYLLRASVLTAANRRKEAIECYRQAIALQPDMFGISRSLAEALDDEQEPLSALTVLDDLEKLGQSGRAAALLERGALFERWGLQKQAADCYENLADSGYGGNPKLQLFLAKTFAALGEKDRAVTILTQIPQYIPEYLPAQLLLAHLADDTGKKLEIVRSLLAKNPAQVSLLVEIMNTSLAARHPDEALSAFCSFMQNYNKNTALPASLHSPVVHALLQADNRRDALALVVDIARHKQQRWWRPLALLLTLDEQPELSADLLPAIPESTLHEALLGFCYACRLKDTNLAKQWQERFNQLDKPAGPAQPSGPAPTPYRLFMSLALDARQQAEAELARLADLETVDYIIASEFVSHCFTAGDRSEAVKLLQAHVALDMGIPALAWKLAMDLLQARPSCQWSAALAAAAAADDQQQHAVLDILEPRDCILAKIIYADLLLREKQYEKAAGLYGELVAAGQRRVDLQLNQGIALENAGLLPQALEIYQRVWKSTTSPVAANNAAYVISQLFPQDTEKLAQARQLIDAAVKALPNEPTFRDTSGWIAYLQGRYDQAGKELLWAVKRLPDSAEIHYHLGLAYSALNHRDFARWHLAAAVQIGQQQAKGENPSPALAEIIRQAQENLAKLEQNQP